MDRDFAEYFRSLEANYLSYDEPWRQSGFSGPEERWEKCRRPIADLVTKSGTFLDIGCANGYLLECVVRWKQVSGITVTPYGLDIGDKLVALAKKRLVAFADHIFAGDAFEWVPPVRFDYVRTELVYVPEELKKRYVERLLHGFLSDGGGLLVCQYRPSRTEDKAPWVDEELTGYGFEVAAVKSAFENGKELTRVALLKQGNAG